VWADECLRRVLADDLVDSYRTVLDVGSGDGEHAAAFRAAGKQVTQTDLRTDGDYLLTDYPAHDLVWCSHVLEHQPNVGLFLAKLAKECTEGGLLAITVPPRKPQIVGGHVSLWNAGLLIYRLALTGLDCRHIAIKSYGYNISAILRKRAAELPRLVWDGGDIDRLAGLLPVFCAEGFDGDITQWNW
jgi:SAM-dependent methyltransferase